MKRLYFDRRAVLRAIRLALAALLFLGHTPQARAQSYSAPFQVSGSTVTTAPGTYGSGSGLYEPGANYSSVTIGSGTTINATAPYFGSTFDVSGLVETSSSSFGNAGNVSLNSSGYGVYQSLIYLNQGALSTSVSNSGSLSSTITTLGSTSYALNIASTSGNITVANTGSIYATGSNDAIAVNTNSTAGGNLSVDNATGATITLGSTGSAQVAVLEHTTGNGTIAFTNEGTISGSAGDGATLLAANGNIQSSNSGMISGRIGVRSETNSGSDTFVNSGTISATQTGVNAYGATASVTNSGSITGTSSSGIYVGGGNVSVVNSGSVLNSNSGIYVSSYASGGSINVHNTGTVNGTAYGIVASGNTGVAITVNNSGTVTSGGIGIQLYYPGTVINSGSITGTTSAIYVPSGSSVTLAGHASTSGTVQGGANPDSFSTLTFALAIPAAALPAARSQLDMEIAAYAAQHGGFMTFTIDGQSFDILNFLYTGGVIDDLMAEMVAATGGGYYAGTPGYYSMGTAIDHFNTGSPQAIAILKALANVPDANLPAALAELSPQSLEVFRNVAFDNNTFNDSQINNHLANLRDGLTGFDSSALTVIDSSMDPSLAQVKSHLLAYDPASTPGLMSDSGEPVYGGIDMRDSKSAEVKTETAEPANRWSSFIAGDVILADLSHNANIADSNYTTGSVTAGADYRIDRHFTVGALFAYAHTGIDLDSQGSSATVDSYAPGIYGSYVNQGWYANFMASYVRNAYTDDRMINIPGISGDNHGAADGNQGTGNLTGGYEFQRGNFKFGPVASLQYVHLGIDSLQEQGPTALNIGSQSLDSFRTLAGVEGRFVANLETPVGPMSLTPHLSLSWQHECLDTDQGITSQFNGTGGGSFATPTNMPDRDSAFVDVGLDAAVAKNVTVFVDYETQVGQSDYFAQSAQGGVRIGF